MNYYRIVLLCVLSLSIGTVQSQVISVNYQLEYVDSTDYYNFNIIINAGSATTEVQRIQFNSQYSLVFPNTLDFTFVKSLMPLLDNIDYSGTQPTPYFIYAEEDVSDTTYLSLRPSMPPDSPISAYNNLFAGDTIPLFVFDMGGYHPDVRLWENGVDNPPTVEDFNQGFVIGGLSQLYSDNSPTAGIPLSAGNSFFEVGSSYASWNRPLFIGDESGVPMNSAILELESTERGFLPPRLTNEEILNIESPEAGLMVYSTTEKMPIYYTGNFWRKSDGQALGAEIGSMSNGGVVIHVSDVGEVLVLDTSLIINEVMGSWGCQGIDISSTESLSGPYDLGRTNTNIILTNCNQSGTAASIVDELSVSQNGITYNDWHLPSAQDFIKISAFNFPLMDANYWLAHQFDDQSAVLNASDTFGSIITETDIKFSQAKVYAVRTFLLE